MSFKLEMTTDDRVEIAAYLRSVAASIENTWWTKATGEFRNVSDRQVATWEYDAQEES